MDMQEDKDRELNSKVLSKKEKEKGILFFYLPFFHSFCTSLFIFFLTTGMN